VIGDHHVRRPGLALVELSVMEQRYRAVLEVEAGCPAAQGARHLPPHQEPPIDFEDLGGGGMMTGSPLSAGVYLLERWLPGIQAVIVRGEAPGELDEDWAELPSVERVARYGGFPRTFPGGGERHPVAVERFEIKDE
jgi:hypothetical protein